MEAARLFDRSSILCYFGSQGGAPWDFPKWHKGRKRTRNWISQRTNARRVIGAPTRRCSHSTDVKESSMAKKPLIRWFSSYEKEGKSRLLRYLVNLTLDGRNEEFINNYTVIRVFRETFPDFPSRTNIGISRTIGLLTREVLPAHKGTEVWWEWDGPIFERVSYAYRMTPVAQRIIMRELVKLLVGRV